MKRCRILLPCLIAIASTMLSACGLREDKAGAETFAASFFETVRAKDFASVSTFYSPQFFEKVSREEWLQSLKNINAKLGDLREYRLVKWNFRKFYGTSGSGTYFQLEYRVAYTKYPADETLTVFKPSGGGGMQILGHHINSEGFLKSQ